MEQKHVAVDDKIETLCNTLSLTQRNDETGERKARLTNKSLPRCTRIKLNAVNVSKERCDLWVTSRVALACELSFPMFLTVVYLATTLIEH